MPVSKEHLQILRNNNEASHRETRECIKSALVELLQKKRFESITMTDIIRKSGVSRSGVYRNYKSKKEIMFDIYREQVDEVFSEFGSSVSENMETIFRVGKQNEKAIKAIIDAGLEHNLLDIMNKRYEGVSVSFYIPLWVGMIYNGFIEWAKSGMDEPMDAAIDRVKAGLILVAESIDTDLTNTTQNKML